MPSSSAFIVAARTLRLTALLSLMGCVSGLDLAIPNSMPPESGRAPTETIGADSQIAQPAVEPGNEAVNQMANGPMLTSGGPMVASQPASAVVTNLTTSPRRPLPLQEVLWLTLQRSDVVRTLSGSVRIEPVTTMDPAIAQASIQSESARFDPRLSASYEGSRINQPPDAFFGPGLSTNTRRDEGNFAARLDKLWEWGATTRLAYDPSLGYLFLPQGVSGGFNPAYSSAVVLDVRQPLFRYAGWKVNTAPIRIASARADQTQWDVQEAVQAKVRSSVEAYWKLHAAFFAWQSIETIVPFGEEIVRIEELRLRSQRSIYADIARASSNLESLRRQRSQAELAVRQRELDLRQLLGLPASDGAVLVPIDQPLRHKVELDVPLVVQTAQQRRPDLNRRRARREEQDWKLAAAQNGLLPQLDLRALYRVNGLKSELDASLNQLADFKYTDWTLGAEFSMPLGNRRGKADLQASELQLMKELALLRGYEEQLPFEFHSYAAELRTTWERFESALRQVQHTQEWLRLARIRHASPPAANRGDDWLLLALQDLQNAMQASIDAQSTASRTLADYNVLLVKIDEAQGVLLDSCKIHMANPAPGPVEAAPLPTAVPIPEPNAVPEAVGPGHSKL